MDYDTYAISGNYDRGRRIPADTIAVWLNHITMFIPENEVRTIIDVGCGTGRFSKLLHEKYQAHIIGIDPSEKSAFNPCHTQHCMI